MSKLADAIRRSQRIEAAPMGFGAARLASKPTMLVAYLGPAARLAEATEKGADLVILDARSRRLSPDDASKARPTAGTLPLGAWMSLDGSESATSLREAGVDFLLVDADSTPAAALLDDKLGYVLSLPASPDELFLRSVEPLSVEAVFLQSLPAPLTVAGQMELMRVGMLTHKPLLAKVEPGADKSELECLRNAGVAVLVVEGAADGLVRLKETVQALPPRRVRRDERPMVTLPRAVVQHDHDEDDDDDD